MMTGSKVDPGWVLQRQERLPSQAAAGAGWRISDQGRSFFCNKPGNKEIITSQAKRLGNMTARPTPLKIAAF
ncbi:unnamed protein product [Gulo gulo]|uniref:Uncharacterized protein n=1 Tax=Gulo gulo TaxID=48420 RepID=A0A9X9LEE5_GULGU|nr:unnamed protein product [Gulo gulo]